MTLPLRTIRRSAAALAVATAVVVPAAPAFAFHHTGVPGSACGNGEWAGGNNPVAKDALVASGHDLPIAPAGTPSAAADTPAMERCSSTE